MKKFDNKFDRYPFSQLPKRPTYSWPNGAKLAVYFALNVEAFEFGRNPGPDFTSLPAAPFHRGFAYRDYGNRVGHMRQMKVLDKYGIRGSISLSSALIDHHPEIIELCVERNWEFFSHGIYNTRYTYGLDEAQEKALIQDSIDSIRNATGEAPVGYLAPALRWAAANGERTIVLDLATSPMKDRPVEGHIGFQDEAKHVWYRNVRIKELR